MAEIITKSYDDALTMGNIKAGFRGSGCWPLNADVVLARHLVREENDGGAIQMILFGQILREDSQLVKQFRSEVGGFTSDSLVPGTSFVSTTSGGDDDIGEHSPCPPLSEAKEKGKTTAEKMSVPTGQSIAVSTRSLRRK